MAWTIEFESTAIKDFNGLDTAVVQRIMRFLTGRLAALDDPRLLGEPLKGIRFSGLCKYRVGDYRIICQIQDARLVILVVRIGHRREVYR